MANIKILVSRFKSEIKKVLRFIKKKCIWKIKVNSGKFEIIFFDYSNKKKFEKSIPK